MSVHYKRPYTLKGVLEQGLRRFADRTALHVGDAADMAATATANTAITYGELDRRSNALAHALADLGVGPDDRVALLVANSLEYVIADLAVIKAGAVKLPLNQMLTAPEFEYMLSDSRASTVVAGPSFLETVDDLRADLDHLENPIGITELTGGSSDGDTGDRSSDETLPEDFSDFDALTLEGDGDTPPDVDVDPSDTVAHYYTGGTTGKPKGVIHTQRNMAMNAYAHVIELGITGDDRLLLMTPLPHSAGLFLWGGLVAGATMVIRDGVETERVLADIEDFGITWTFMVPTMIYRVLDHPDLGTADTSSLETLVYGAAPMTASRLEDGLDAFGPVFCQFYGQTEVPNLITSFGKQEHRRALERGDEARLNSAGQPSLMADVRVVDPETGEELPAGQEGEILATAPYVLTEYFERPEQTAETLEGGWVRTGDVGTVDEEGYLTLLDRASDVIISGGMNVYSTEVEDVLDRLEGIAEVAVIGVPHEDWGEAVHAVIVRRDESLTEANVREFADAHLADYKKPKSIEFVDEIPKTPYGKQDKVALREPYWEDQDRDIS